MACVYNAKNGKRSKLYQDVRDKYGDVTAVRTFLSTRMDDMQDTIKRLNKDENGEPTLFALESNDLISFKDENIETDVRYQQETADNLQRIFKESGVDVDIIIDTDYEQAGALEYVDGKPILTINPTKLREDTFQHEFAHILVDMVGVESNIFKAAVNQLQNTEIWEAVRKAYPELSEEQFRKEVVTTAVGMKAVELSRQKDGVNLLTRINRLIRKFGEALGIVELDAARVLAEKLTNPNALKNLKIRANMMTQQSRQLSLANSLFKTKEDLLVKMKEKLHIKINTYYKGMEKAQLRVTDNYLQLAELQQLLEEHGKVSALEGITAFLREAIIQTAKLERHVNGILNVDFDNPSFSDEYSVTSKLNSSALKSMIDYNSAFEIINDVVDVINLEPELKQYLIDEGIYPQIGEIVRRYEFVKNTSKRLTIMYLAEWLERKGEGRVKNQRRLEYERLYDVEHEAEFAKAMKLKGDEKFRTQYKEDRRRFVEEQLDKNKADIRHREISRFMYLLEQSNGDIGMLSRQLLDGDAINDDIVQAITEELDRVDFMVEQDVNVEYEHMLNAVEEFEKIHNEGSQLERYGAIIEDEVEYDETTGYVTKTTRKTANLISKYYNKFYELRSEKWKAYDAAVEEFGVNSPEAGRAKDDVKRWLRANTVRHPTERGKFLPARKWQNPQYDALYNENIGHARIYKYFTDLIDKTNYDLPRWARLAVKRDDGSISYKLPNAKKQAMEQAFQQGIGYTIYDKLRRFGRFINPFTMRSAFKEYFAFLSNQEEYGSNLNPNDYGNINAGVLTNRMAGIITDEQGKEKSRLPINNRFPLPIDEQSWDIPSLLLMDFAMAKNYVAKKEIQTNIELTRDLIKERKIVQTAQNGMKGRIAKINKLITGKAAPITKDGNDSNSYKALESIIEDRLYGVRTRSGVKINTIASMIASYTGTTMLALNYVSAAANLGTGILYDTIAAVGGKYFSRKNIRNAHGIYLKEMFRGEEFNDSVLADVGRRGKQNKLNVWLRVLDVKGDWQALEQQFHKDTRLKELFNMGTLHFMSNGGEHMIQGVLMLSMLDNIKALDKDGNYLTKDGVTTDISKAANLFELSKAENGTLVFDDRIARTTDNNNKFSNTALGNESLFITGKRINDLNAYIQGQYSSKKRSEIQRYWYGTLIMLLRKWMARGFTYRWRGIGNAFIAEENLLEDDMFYSRSLRSGQEGYYTTTMKMLSGIYKDMKQGQFNVAARWSKMDEQERANIKKSIIEAANIVILFALYKGLKKMGDDDKDKKLKGTYYFLAFQAMRLKKELMNFINPAEFGATLRSPSASLKMFDATLSLLEQMMSPTEKYKTGHRKGQYKINKKFLDLFPAVRYVEKAANFEQTNADALRFFENKRL